MILVLFLLQLMPFDSFILYHLYLYTHRFVSKPNQFHFSKFARTNSPEYYLISFSLPQRRIQNPVKYFRWISRQLNNLCHVDGKA